MDINETISFAPSASPVRIRKFGLIENPETLIIAVLVGVICCLMTLLIAVIMPYVFPRPDDELGFRETMAADPEKVKRRCQTIEDWLVVKEIVESSSEENCIHREDFPPRKNDAIASRSEEEDVVDDDDNNSHGKQVVPDEEQATSHNTPGLSADSTKKADHREQNVDGSCRVCQICIEEFKVGEKASWSIGCDHVYHFTCIQEWLLKKKECPYCRQIMLPVDATDDYDALALMKQKQKRSQSTLFSLEYGLVVSEAIICQGDNVTHLSVHDIEKLVIESPIEGAIAPMTRRAVAEATAVNPAADSVVSLESGLPAIEMASMGGADSSAVDLESGVQP